MASFRDSKNREWQLRVSIATCDLVMEATGIDLYALPEDGCKPLGELLGPKLPKLGGVLYVLCKRQADKMTPPVDPFEFADELWGDTLRAAVTAFVEALTDFFPSPTFRQMVRDVVSKNQMVLEAGAKLAIAELAAIEPETEAEERVKAAKEAKATGRQKVSPVEAAMAETPPPVSVCTPGKPSSDASTRPPASPG